jgi:hypothetical protein
MVLAGAIDVAAQDNVIKMAQLADLLRRTRWDRGRLTDEATAAALGGTTTTDSSGEQRRGFFLGQTAFRRATRNGTGGWE